MFKQICIFISVVLIVMIIPGLENSIDAIKSGKFLNEYVLKAILYSYAFGVFTGYIIYILLKKISDIKQYYLFFIQLTVSIVAAFVMIIYTMALMSV